MTPRKLKGALKKSKQEDSNQNLFCFEYLFGACELIKVSRVYEDKVIDQ